LKAVAFCDDIMTKHVALIGYPLRHSISPSFQQAAFAHYHLDIQYEGWETEASEQAAHFFTELTSSLTGMDLNVERFMRIGRRVHNLEKAFNTLHAGFTRRDDYPPKRYWNEPVKSGPFRGERIDHDAWERMLDEYYSLQGWDTETGWQRRETLEALDMKPVADRLGNAGLLP